jgi:Icc-related predicted phosphoesterase
MKVVCLGDTHRSEHEVIFPEGDLLIHTGDFDIRTINELQYINKWFNSLNFEHIIFTGGNHDFYLQKHDSEYINSFFDKAVYLCNEGIEINGKKFWASPYTPEFHNWAFMYPRCSEEAKKLWNQIPNNLDVLITHGPPYKILDQNRDRQHCGCEVLEREVFLKNPKNHVFGHIHRLNESYLSHIKIENTNFYNVSVLDEDYNLFFKPTIFEA